MMFERLNKYNSNCKLLKQIQSNKALLYRRLNYTQNFLTVFVSAFITFIGFSGYDRIQSYIEALTNQKIDIRNIEMMFNLLVFLLFFIGIVHLVFHFGSKQNEAERAITLLSGLSNEIFDILEMPYALVNDSQIKLVADKYTLITQIIPSNTDREYKKAKSSLQKKNEAKSKYVIRNSLALSEKEQEAYIIGLLQNNKSIQKILDTLNSQNKELYLGGGLIRNIVWDNLHGYSETTPIDDVDVIYFNELACSKEIDVSIENALEASIPNLVWSVKNQARMHTINNDDPYKSLEDAVSKWPETVSAILVKKDDKGEYTFIAPFKYDDLFRLIVQPTPHFQKRIDKYRKRITDKQWEQKWKNLKILYME